MAFYLELMAFYLELMAFYLELMAFYLELMAFDLWTESGFTVLGITERPVGTSGYNLNVRKAKEGEYGI
ncbi:hypothetical protein AAK899_08820 [Erysipelotrichaceae bacterium 51-3]